MGRLQGLWFCSVAVAVLAVSSGIRWRKRSVEKASFRWGKRGAEEAGGGGGYRQSTLLVREEQSR